MQYLSILASGLFNLQGIDAKLSAAIVDAMYEAILTIDSNKPLDILKISNQAYQIFQTKYGRIGKIQTLYPDAEFKLFNFESEK